MTPGGKRNQRININNSGTNLVVLEHSGLNTKKIKLRALLVFVVSTKSESK